MALIELEKVSRVYRRGGEDLYALADFGLSIEEGDFVAIMGPSGSGKSTLLNLLGGLDRADQGSVRVAGEDLGALAGADLAQFRADSIGFVFQGFNLLPVLTAVQNVELPLLLTPLSRAERRKHALYALKLVGLEDRVNHRPRELSGGQEQRVAIARALANAPRVLIADEPTGNLDMQTADRVFDLLLGVTRETGVAALIATHNPELAARMDRTVTLRNGLIEPA